MVWSILQIESLSHQLLNQEKELQHSSQQLQNAIAMATEEAIKSRAAKEVIKSLTAQVLTVHVDGMLEW
jgi:predicted transcriptional regulator